MQRERDIESLQLAKETRKRERALRRQQEQELQKAMKQNAQQRRQSRRQRASFAPLPDVLSEADVVLVVLDARDPAACRCAALERALIDCEKLPVRQLVHGRKSDGVRGVWSMWSGARGAWGAPELVASCRPAVVVAHSFHLHPTAPALRTHHTHPPTPPASPQILVLNKIDLVPRAAAEGWLAALRRSLPASW